MKKFEKDWAYLFEWITEVLVESEIVPTKKELKKYIVNSGYYTTDLQEALKEKEISEEFFLKEIIADLRDAYKEMKNETYNFEYRHMDLLTEKICNRNSDSLMNEVFDL